MDAVPIVPPLFQGTKNTTLHELQTGDRSRATDTFGLRRLLSLIAGLTLWAAAAWPAPADPSAAGLWQKIENGEPRLYVLVVDHKRVFEGFVAKTLPTTRGRGPR